MKEFKTLRVDTRKMFFSFRIRLLFFLLLPLSLLMLLSGAYSFWQEERRFASEQERSIAALHERLAIVLPQAIDDLDLQYIEDALQAEVGHPVIGQVRVYAAEGTDQTPSQFVTESATLLGQAGQLDSAVQGQEHVLSLQHYDYNEPIAWLSVTSDLSVRQEYLRQAIISTIAKTIAINLVVGLLMWFVVRLLTKPISGLTQSVSAIAKGNLHYPIEYSGADEIGRLAYGLRTMQRSLVEKIEEIEAHNKVLDQRISERTAELSEAQERLMTAAAEAGRAQIATGVLHNIGNLMTSQLTNCNKMHEQLNDECFLQLRQVSNLVQDHSSTLASYLSEDPTGSNIPRLLMLLLARSDDLLSELKDRHAKMRDGLDKITETVSLQQDFARPCDLTEPVDLQAEVESLIQLEANSYESCEITILREFDQVPKVLAQRARVAAVIHNVLKNAREAMCQETISTRCLALKLAQAENKKVDLTIQDSGIGIDEEGMATIFSFGVSSKADGHGFGLHHSANVMVEMGGELQVHSEGVGKGAAFTLRLPMAG